MPFEAAHYDNRQADQRSASPLWWFVSLSLLLHLALLLEWRQSPTTVTQYRTAGLAVHLVERQQPNPIREKQPAPQHATTAARPRQAPSPQPQPISENPEPRQAVRSGIESNTPLIETLAHDDVSAIKSQAIDEAALHSSLKVTLHQEIARHFNYPLLARRHGWQGEVVLAFRLEADGRITDAHVAQSSGFSVLDRAALTALGKVKRINSGAQVGIAMQLPVIYRLEG